MAVSYQGKLDGPNDVRYTIRFDPEDYSPSTYVDVTRLALNEWEIAATEQHRAQLVSPDTPGGKREPTDEGLYQMPFRIRVTVP